jgi:hypothetical protein
MTPPAVPARDKHHRFPGKIISPGVWLYDGFPLSACAGPVVLLTAQAGAEDTTVGCAAGGTDSVTKPCQPAHLRAHVPTWLRRTRAGREGT